MRLDLIPILAEAGELMTAIEAKSLSRSSSHADALMKALPSPVWAETTPGCTIYYGDEREVNTRIIYLRKCLMSWMGWLTTEEISHEADDEWPSPARLELAIARLAEYRPVASQNASVSENTDGKGSYSEAGSEPDRNASDRSAPVPDAAVTDITG